MCSCIGDVHPGLPINLGYYAIQGSSILHELASHDISAHLSEHFLCGIVTFGRPHIHLHSSHRPSAYD